MSWSLKNTAMLCHTESSGDTARNVEAGPGPYGFWFHHLHLFSQVVLATIAKPQYFK